MNRFLFLLLFYSFFSLAQIPTNGLIGGWPFSGNANDMSGSGNHGTVYGASLTQDRFGYANSAYYFDGTTNYVQMLTAGPTGTVSRSISFWAKTSNTLIQVGFNYGGAGNNGIYQILFNYNCQGVGFDNSTGAFIRGNNNLTNDQWHHIVAVFNSSVSITNGSIDFYVDAVLQPSITCFVTSTTSPLNSNNAYPIVIGRSSNSPVRYFKGNLDDFYFYNRPLSYSEVQQLYNYSPCTGGPASPSAISGLSSACIGNPVTFSVLPVSGATSYIWYLPGGWTGTSNTNTIQVVPNVSSGVVSVLAQNGCGQSSPVSHTVSVSPSPSLTVQGNLPICIGNSLTLTAGGASTYTWNTGSQSSTLYISPGVNTSYTVTGSAINGCTNSLVTNVSVSSNVAPSISVAGPEFSCEGQPANLASNGASTYTWQPGNVNGFFVTVSPTVTTTYTVYGTASNGCSNWAQYTHTVMECTGLAENETLQFSIYPNPSTDLLFFSKEVNNAKVIDLTGRLFLQSSSPSNYIDISALSSGVYMLEVIDTKGNRILKKVSRL